MSQVDPIKKARTEGVEAMLELIAALTNERLEALQHEAELCKGASNAKMSARMRSRIEQLQARHDELQRLCAQIQAKIEAWPQEEEPT